MKNIDIRVCGKIGNFIIMLSNAIKIALFYNYNVIIPNHPYINTTYIVINNDINLNNEKIIDPYDFFYKTKIKNIDTILFKKNTLKTLEILKSCFALKNEIQLGDNDLLIHIRSSDIFGDNPHPSYLTPPLSYYVNIIDKNNFNEIYLIAEDRINPCINRLLQLYPKIKFKIQSLEEDVKLILGAKNVVMGFGTFIPSLLLVSDNIKNLYKPSYMNNDETDVLNRIIKVFNIELSAYKKRMTPWKNTLEQRKFMLTYK